MRRVMVLNHDAHGEPKIGSCARPHPTGRALTAAQLKQPLMTPAPNLAEPLICQVVSSADQFDEIRADWLGMAGNPTVDPDFCRLLAESRSEIIRPHIVVVREGGKIVGLLAGRVEGVTVNFRVGYRRLFGIRARSLTLPYGGVMGSEREDVYRVLLAHIMNRLKAGEFDLADLDNLRIDSSLQRCVKRFVPWYCRAHFQVGRPHWTMALPGTGEEIEKNMSKKHRYWIRRVRKRLLERFPDDVEFSCIEHADDISALAAQIESIACTTYQRGIGVGFVNDEEHRRRLNLWSARRLMRVFLLRVQGRPVAFCLGTRLHETFFLSHTAFVPDMGEFEPGTLIFLHMLDGLCREGVKSLDFGLGDAFYKQRFGTGHWEESIVCVFSPHLRGLLLNLTDSTSRLLNFAGRRILYRLGSLKKLKKMWRQRLARKAETAVGGKMVEEA